MGEPLQLSSGLSVSPHVNEQVAGGGLVELMQVAVNVKLADECGPLL